MKDFLQITADEFLPLRDVVFKTLRKAILLGELEPGERLREIQLAERMGVSRTPIREAIRMLELEGLVVMKPRCGAEVSQITAKGLKDVLEVRTALEELAIKLACDRITKEQLERLTATMEEFEKAIHSKKEVKIAGADVRFHDIIVEASGNDRLLQMTSNLSEQFYRYRYEYVKDAGRHEELIEEHRLMVDSVVRKDKEKAAETVRLHIANQETAITRKLHLE